jgi:hypothetical protein
MTTRLCYFGNKYKNRLQTAVLSSSSISGTDVERSQQSFKPARLTTSSGGGSGYETTVRSHFKFFADALLIAGIVKSSPAFQSGD